MANLISTTVTAPQTGSWPQVMTIVQEFDHPVIVTEDFKLIFYTKNTNKPNEIFGQMAATPVQFVPTQLSYTVQISPFGDGALGVFERVGGAQDIYGNPVDFKIGEDFDIYNTTIRPYFSNPTLTDSGWQIGYLIPPSGICPGTTAPKVGLKVGPWENSMAIPDQMWSGGNFYIWCNYTWKPDLTSQGIPFVFEPPFYYSFSQFGIPFDQTNSPLFPPYPLPAPSILNNVISSGTQTGWDTCGGWVQEHTRWRGRVQMWLFGSNVFADGVVPWNFPGVANPTGDLSPQAQFGFPPDAQLQVYKELPFFYSP